MFDIKEISELASAVKDISLTGALIWALAGVFNRKWVPGAYYQDQVARAEKAEATASLAHDAADRATRVSEQLVQIVRERER